jgi:hypothetical protein
MAAILNTIKSNLSLILSYMLLLSGLLQVFIGEFLGPISVRANTIPMVNSFSADRTNDKLVLYHLHAFAKQWVIVTYSGFIFVIIGFIFLVYCYIIIYNDKKQSRT